MALLNKFIKEMILALQEHEGNCNYENRLLSARWLLQNNEDVRIMDSMCS
jgi:hypothetical protein